MYSIQVFHLPLSGNRLRYAGIKIAHSPSPATPSYLIFYLIRYNVCELVIKSQIEVVPAHQLDNKSLIGSLVLASSTASFTIPLKYSSKNVV